MKLDKGAILASMAIIMVASLLAGAGTMAILSDTETSTGNKFTAGTLNLKVGGNDPCTWHATIGPIKPGDSGTIEVPFTVQGNMEGYVDVRITNVQDSGGSNPESELVIGSDDGELSGELIIPRLGLIHMYYTDTMSFESMNDVWWFKDGGLSMWGADGMTYTPTVTDSIIIDWELPSDVGNVVQGDVLTFDIEFTLTQGKSGISWTP